MFVFFGANLAFLAVFYSLYVYTRNPMEISGGFVYDLVWTIPFMVFFPITFVFWMKDKDPGRWLGLLSLIVWGAWIYYDFHSILTF